MKNQIEVTTGRHDDGTAIVTLVDAHVWQEELHDGCISPLDKVCYLWIVGDISDDSYESIAMMDDDFPDIEWMADLRTALGKYSEACDLVLGFSDAENIEFLTRLAVLYYDELMADDLNINIWDASNLADYVETVNKIIKNRK